MLYDIDGKPKTGIPRRRQDQWRLWRNNITDADFDVIVQQINDFCDVNDRFNSSFVPKKIWGNEPCQPLLDACNQSEVNAGFFFGLIVWHTLVERRVDNWMFQIAPNDDEVQGTDYWRIGNND